MRQAAGGYEAARVGPFAAKRRRMEGGEGTARIHVAGDDADMRDHVQGFLREPREVRRVLRLLRREIGYEQGCTVEAPARHTPAARRYSDRAAPSHETEGTVVTSVEASPDRRELTRAAEKLQKNEERTRLILDTMLDAVVTMDADGVIIDWNTQAERMFGWSREDAIGRPMSDTLVIVPSKHRPIHQHGVRDFPEPGEDPALTGWIEMTAVHRHGREFPVELSITPVRLGQTSTITVLVHDITKRRQAEEALRLTQAELIRVTRLTTMGELTASIAHEINQPLAAVLTSASACSRVLAGRSPDLNDVREAVTQIAEAGMRASGVISRIRAFLKRPVLEKVPADVNELIQETIALAHGELHNHQVSVRTELRAGLPSVLADRVQLQQVVLNLLMNSIDAMTVVTSRPRVLLIRSQLGEPGSVLVAVEDSGVGIDPVDMDRIFNAFFTTKRDGMGMGLPISRSIIEAHGGRLWAAPNAGEGVTFQFTLPAHDQVP